MVKHCVSIHKSTDGNRKTLSELWAEVINAIEEKNRASGVAMTSQMGYTNAVRGHHFEPGEVT